MNRKFTNEMKERYRSMPLDTLCQQLQCDTIRLVEYKLRGKSTKRVSLYESCVTALQELIDERK